MKHKILALVLALTIVAWAQTAPKGQPSTSQSNASGAKGEGSCCERSSGAKDSCPHHAKHAGEGKEQASCCTGKDAKSCQKSAKNGASCCGEKCGQDKAACSREECAKACKNECCSKATAKAGRCCASETRS